MLLEKNQARKKFIINVAKFFDTFEDVNAMTFIFVAVMARVL